MLDRYNPEDFINIKVVGKVTPVKGKEAEDLVQVLVEVSFNNALYNEKFIPDLKQVLDNIASKKKDIVLNKQRDVLRTIANGKLAPMADNSVILYGSNLGKEYSLAVYDKPDRLGCRLYAFSKDDADKILNNQTGVLAKFRGRIARLKGFEVELLDENDSPITTNEQKAVLPFLLTDSVIRNDVWAFHPTIMKYAGLYDFVPLYNECRTVTLPLRFELIPEHREITAAIATNFMYEDNFADAAIRTRNALHNAAINALPKNVNNTEANNNSNNRRRNRRNDEADKTAKNTAINPADFEAAADIEYPLAEIAKDSIEAIEIMNTK